MGRAKCGDLGELMGALPDVARSIMGNRVPPWEMICGASSLFHGNTSTT